MLPIEPDNGTVTLINVFDPQPGHFDDVLELLRRAADAIQSAPGLIGTAVHVSDDRSRVINYAQWDSSEHLWAAVREPSFTSITHPILEMATARPNTYTVDVVRGPRSSELAKEFEATYRRMLEIVASGLTEDLPAVLDPERYQEECVGVTPGWVDYQGAVASLKGFLPSVPGLEIEVVSSAVDLEQRRLIAVCRSTVTGVEARPTFGSVDVVTFGADGRIVRRWQLSIPAQAG